MDVNSISRDVIKLTIPTTKSIDSLGHPSEQRGKSIYFEASSNIKFSYAKDPSQNVGIESKKKPVQVNRHVVVEYNYQGKVCIKFMDNNNTVVYQTPSVMAAKMEDQMMKLVTSSSIIV